MRRLVPSIRMTTTALLLGAVALTGCATYRQDLERAQAHYEKNEFDQSLALLRVLEFDLDSLSPTEQARYAYVRGMTDFRLSGLSSQATGVRSPKQDFRSNARHWLALSDAIDKANPGSIGDDERQRLADTLKDLNRDVYGGSDATTDVTTGPATAAPAGKPGASMGSMPDAAPASNRSAPPAR